MLVNADEATATPEEEATGFTSGVKGTMSYDRGLLRIDWPCGPRWYPIWHLRDQYEAAPPERKEESQKRLDFLFHRARADRTLKP